MLKKTITFNNLDDEPVTHDFYFNLTAIEVAELQNSVPGGLIENLQTTMMNNPSGADLMQALKIFVLASIGRRSDDNLSFDKDEAYADRFRRMDAYSVLMNEFATDARNIAEFMAGIMPKNFREKFDIEQALRDAEAQVKKNQPAIEGEVRVQKTLDECTNEELVDMPLDELNRRIAAEGGKVPKKVLILGMQRTLSEK